LSHPLLQSLSFPCTERRTQLRYNFSRLFQPYRAGRAHPNDRDRALHVIRITALIGVVAGHTVKAISVIHNHVLIWDTC
jgi:hypothetical protein